MRDPERFTQLLKQHQGILYKIAHAYCRTPSDRGDLVQEAIVQLWRAWPRYDEGQRFSTWMYRIALNVAISFYRKATRRERDVVPLDDIDVEGPAEPEDVLRLQAHIRELGELDRALVLFYLDGYSHDEIAGLMGTTATNVSTRLHRIKAKLQERMES